MLRKMEVFLIVVAFILITAVILIVYSKQRENDFRFNNVNTQTAIVEGAAFAIKLQLLEKHRHVSLFATEYLGNLIQLNNNPNNQLIEDDIDKRLQQRFSDFFTYTITDEKGSPKLLNIESLVGHACQLDLNHFSKTINRNKKIRSNQVIIHPQPFNYHYDIMTPLYISGSKPRIFFVSFNLDRIINTLKTHQIPGQELIIVRQSDTSLIEITSKGSRDKLKREMNLNADELENITAFKDIHGTDWRLVSLNNSDYLKKHIKSLWKEAIIIILLVSFALLILSFVLFKMSAKRQSIR